MILVRLVNGEVVKDEVRATQKGVAYNVVFVDSGKRTQNILSDTWILVDSKKEATVVAREMRKRYPKKKVVEKIVEVVAEEAPEIDFTLVEKALKERYGKGCREVKYKMPCTCKTCVYETSIVEEKKGVLCHIDPRPEDGEDGVCLGYEEDKAWRRLLMMAGDGAYTLRSALFPDTDKIGDYRG